MEVSDNDRPSTLDDFLARYNGETEHGPAIEIEVEEGHSRFIVIRHGSHAVVVNPIALSDHLSVDVHPFEDGERAVGGVFGMTEGERFSLPKTGRTSHGWPGSNLVAILVGRQGEEPREDCKDCGCPEEPAHQNDTYGELTNEELAAARDGAKPCVQCGMLATVDPILHESRYGHAPVVKDGTGELIWSSDGLSWIANER